MTKNNTLVKQTTNQISVTLHQTEVFRLEGNKVTLDNGGWMTSTTKNRMNEAAEEFASGRFRVYQRKGAWFVYFYTKSKAGDLNNPPIFDFFSGESEIPDPDQPFQGWKEIPFVDGMSFEVVLT